MEDRIALSPAESETRAFIWKVYGWMTAGLAMTGLISVYMAGNPELISQLMSTPFLFWSLIIVEFIMVASLAGLVHRMSATAATVTFLVYSGLNGVTASLIFLAYTHASIASTFFITAGTFGLMSLYGATTKTNLTSIGNFCVMGLIGIILASVVNIFMKSSAIYWATTYIGVFVFVGLTAYDTQRIKNLNMAGMEGTDEERSMAILGALTLYLDFVNLFFDLLRLTGKKR